MQQQKVVLKLHIPQESIFSNVQFKCGYKQEPSNRKARDHRRWKKIFLPTNRTGERGGDR